MIRISEVKAKGVASVKAEVINDLKSRGYLVAGSERGARALLDRLGVKYEKGNDAPRGGLTGNYIRIITKIVEG